MTRYIQFCQASRGATIAALVLVGVMLGPIGSASAQGCGGGPLSTSTGNLVGSALGGAAGGLLGNQFGSGTGKGVMTGVGVVGGALAGGYVGRSMEGCGQAAQRPPAQRTTAQPASRGTVTPVSTRGEPPRTCRSVIGTTTIDGQQQQLETIACLDPDGVWRTASGPAAERAAQEDLVLRTQQRLRDQGYYVRDNIDGRWGPATSAALGNFQRANGLSATGRIDPPTRTALGLDPAPIAQAAAPTDQQPPAQQQPVQAGTSAPPPAAALAPPSQ